MGGAGAGYAADTVVRGNTIIQRPGESRCSIYVQGRVRNLRLENNTRTGGTCDLTADNPGEVTSTDGGDTTPPATGGSLGSLGF